ncbi:D-glycero-beta-D-manno-heptose-7-phosphate kinase [Halalkalibacterium ligniniphilum]|uniref:D-glycero-beta-D-manno-heptose-7-phosphate kinase n=1 Tax=Halalkalibacterium ligniniphilum TaxID=1134413 RepID=UPI00037E8507|nr:D-glycero-beta-D-manno-heptose-7-phosphate kinase [Halalkalibacterium ligniniphilum]
MLNNKLSLAEYLSKDLQKLKVLVIGDIMLDIYYQGDVNRVSPEAPVPVVSINQINKNLGGAANVATNLKGLGCQVEIIGLIGNDNAGEDVCKLLSENNINHNLVKEEGKQTTTKTRVVGGHQQIVRFDHESISFDAKASLRLKKVIKRSLETNNPDSVIISDYAKGVCSIEICSFIIESCYKKNIPVVVDPKGTDWQKYSGAYMVTPNLNELSEVLGEKIENVDTIVSNVAYRIKNKFTINNIVVTRSEKGITLVCEKEVLHDIAKAREVYDVSGAGDTVIATLAAFINKRDLKSAIKVANIAAGIVVGKPGTVAINKTDLLKELNNRYKNISDNKIKKLEKMIQVIKEWRNNGEEVVFTNGCFDILHSGHISYLEKARQLGDRLIIGLNSDDSVKRLKGITRPINNENDRAKLLAALEFVDGIIIFEENTPKNLIKEISPDILVKGGDYKINEIVGREFAKRVEVIPFLEGYSTTNIIEKILI